MIVLLCYFVLCVITIYLVVTVLHIIRKTSSLILVTPIFVMYFWSLFGVWSWIPMKLGGGFNFYESIMFVVNIDEFYLESLVLYSIFIGVFTAYVNNFARNQHRDTYQIEQKKIKYRGFIDKLAKRKPYYVIIYSMFFYFVFMSMRDISSAIQQGVSAYGVSRFDSSLGGLNTLVDFFGNTSMYLIIPLLFSNRTKKFKIIYIICPLIMYFTINLLLGNRNILLSILIIIVILFSELNGLKKTFRPHYLLLAFCGLLGIQLISFIRGISIAQVLAGDFEFSIKNLISSLGNSAEQYAAQLSMYGVLKNEVPCTFGTSLLFLFSTFVPAFLGLPRPDRIYMYYVMQTMHGKPDIGVTIHHATAWYLNFGLIGIIVGALLWGVFLKFLYKRRLSFIYFYGSILFSVASIQMIRDGGPESYKGALLLVTIIPMLIIHFCLKKIRY